MSTGSLVGVDLPESGGSTRVPVAATVQLECAGVGVLLSVRDGRLPEVAHWGPALGRLDAAGADALAGAQEQRVGPNTVGVPVRVALLPEAGTGWTGRPGLSGSRDGAGWSPRFDVHEVLLDGAPVEGFTGAGSGVVQFAATDSELGLDLLLTMELTQSGVLRSRARLTNTWPEPYEVNDLVLAYPVPAEAAELLDFAGRWGRERVPQRSAFTVGTHLREGRRGRTGADAAYLLHAGTPGFGFADGEVYAVHTAWSGNHTHYAERVFGGERVLGGGELLLPGEVVLGEGQSYESPWVYTAFGRGLDEVARRFHRLLRARPSGAPSVERPVTINVWEAVYFDHDVDRLTDLAERAAALGVERYVLDDGWFGARRDDHAGLGDWVVSPDVWPNGLHPLVDRVRELGMQFGLWFEPEMVNVDSDVVRAHPDWVMAARSELPVESRFQQVLDLAIPEAFSYVLGQMSAVLDEYDISYIKWDHNRDLVEAGNQTRGGRPAVHDQTLAFYRLVDALKAAHPGLEIESCSSGGARIDLEVAQHTDRVWVSDCNDPLERQEMMRWTGQLLPPEFLGSHIASGRSHTTGRIHDLGFRAATAVFGHLGIEWDLADASPGELDDLAAWVAFFKEHRGLLMRGDVVRMDGFDDHLRVHGVVATDQSEAIFAMVTTGSLDASPGPRLRFRGLDPNRDFLLRPLLVGTGPGGLEPARWWGAAPAYPGAVFRGSTLEHVGVAAPKLFPDQAVLFHAFRA